MMDLGRQQMTGVTVAHADGTRVHVRQWGDLDFDIRSIRADVPLESGAFTFAPLVMRHHIARNTRSSQSSMPPRIGVSSVNPAC